MTINLSQNSIIIRNSAFPPVFISTVEIRRSVETSTAIAKALQIQTIFSNSRSAVNQPSLKYTKRDPAVIPDIAMLIEKNARWYHEMTDKILVSMIWSINPHMQIRNTPRRNHSLALLRLIILARMIVPSVQGPRGSLTDILRMPKWQGLERAS